MKQILLVFLLGINLIYAQESNLKTEQFVVKGNCGMCKTRIENVVNSQPSANGEWNQGTKILTITYDESKTSSDKILRLVADAGHDNEKYESEDETYENLPGCCLYEKDLSFEEYKEKYKSGNFGANHNNHSSHENHSNHGLKTEQFVVKGNCGMCKTRIENVVNSQPSANGEWNQGTKILTITYDESKTSSDKILRLVADAGHDNEKYESEDETYENLPGCCLYEKDLSFDEYKEKYKSGNLDPHHNIIHDEHQNETEHSEHSENQNHTNHSNDSDNHENHDAMNQNNEDSVELESANIEGSKAATALDTESADLTYNIDEKELLKAACCNISESFETNAAVDVSYSDAVTGSRQILMLGLNQNYTHISTELLPNSRGLSKSYGLDFLPGKWVSGIQLTKGASSVVYGYESITGQINTEFQKYKLKPKTQINLYANTGTRIEGNVVHTSDLNSKWSQSILVHGNGVLERLDKNDDNFLDIPVGRQLNLGYILKYYDFEKSGWGTQFGVQFLNSDRLAGEVDYNSATDRNTTNNYGIEIDRTQFNFWNKIGHIFKGKPYQSFGFMQKFTYQDQFSNYGLLNYNGTEQTYYANLIFESIIGNTNHKYKAGASFLWDSYDETYDNQNFERTETVPGAFAEYTYTGLNLTAVVGSRVDFHNQVGTQFSPRVNVKYNPLEKTTLRVSAGRGFRTANVFAENQRYFPSNRRFNILSTSGDIYGLDPEIAWNYGISLAQEFKLFHNKSTLVVDFFRTDFQNQVVVDADSSPNEVRLYNLDGDSYANSLQIQLDIEPIRRLKARIAYKYYENMTTYTFGEEDLPFIPNHRGFLNLAYTGRRNAKKQRWSFDSTLQWVGEQRIPNQTEKSESYFLLSGQIAREFSKKVRVYVGGENILSYTQDNPIVDAENPFGNDFDASLVYAPIFPAMVYVGVDFEF